VADDKNHLEAVKLRLDLLRHITTLSGVAIVIVLTLMERTESDEMLWGWR
jgi:hypothetical protein